MSLNEWADAQELDEYECLNCGRTLPAASNDVEICSECCGHENTRDILTGTKCEDCGNMVN